MHFCYPSSHENQTKVLQGTFLELLIGIDTSFVGDLDPNIHIFKVGYAFAKQQKEGVVRRWAGSRLGSF